MNKEKQIKLILLDFVEDNYELLRYNATLPETISSVIPLTRKLDEVLNKCVERLVNEVS